MDWLRLYVLGPPDTGKSSLVKALLGNDYRDPPSPTVSSSSSSSFSSLSSSLYVSTQINVHRWKNLTGEDSESSGGLEVWDLPGNQTLREAHLLYLVGPCVILLVSSVDHRTEDLLSVLSVAVSKCPEAQFLVALTHRGQMVGEDNNDVISKRAEDTSTAIRDWLARRKSVLQHHIQNIKATVEGMYTNQPTSGDSAKDRPEKTWLVAQMATSTQHVLNTTVSFAENVFIVNINSYQGIHELQRALLTLSTNYRRNEQPHGGLTSTLLESVSKIVLELRDSGIVLLPWRSFWDSLLRKLSLLNDEHWREPDFDATAQQLQTMGLILNFRCMGEIEDASSTSVTNTERDSNRLRKEGQPQQKSTSTTNTPNTILNSADCSKSEQSYVCVDPESFANMISACVIEDNKRTFRFEAGRFWPSDSGFQPPDPHSLARVLEDIPAFGLVREGILPLLWQDLDLTESQIKHCLALLQRLGVLTEHTAAKSDIAGLAMPEYLGLSAVQCYSLLLLDLMPNSKPQLNWTTKPHKGDLQVCWGVTGLSTPPVSVLRRALAVLKWTSRHQCHYSHSWREGLLIRFEDVTMCLEVTSSGVSIISRVNGDEPGQEQVSLKLLWAHLVPVVLTLETFLEQELPGAAFTESISLHGDEFFNNITTNEDVSLSLEQCLLAWRTTRRHITVPYREESRRLDLDLLFPFKGDETNTVWTPADWKALVMKKRAVTIRSGTGHTTARNPNGIADLRGITLTRTRSRSRRQAAKKKVISVSWKSNLAEDLEKRSFSINHKGNSAASPSPKHLGPGTQTQSDQLIESVTSPPSQKTTATSSSSSSLSPTAPATAVSTSAPTAAPSREMSPADVLRERTEIATRLVTAMMAAGVAKYISTCCSAEADGGSGVLTAAQVSAARATAEAALAVHAGKLDGAASAVIDSLRAAQGSWSKSRGSRSSSLDKSSKTCAVL